MELGNKFQFVMNWFDLPEEYREEKITEVIEKRIKEEDWDWGERSNTPKEELADNPSVRLEVENWIDSHFPIYF